MNRPLTAYGDSRPDNAVALRLGRLARLSSVEMDILRDLSQTARQSPAHAELCVEGRIQPPLMLLSGWACHQRILGDGRRQIVRFLLPGDAIGSLSRPGLPASSSALALTPVVVADARPLLRNADENGVPLSGLAEAVARMSYADEINLRDQVVRLGRQTAYERLVHLVLEFYGRLQAIGMVDGDSFALPLTQDILADALGLSVVHINRTLQQVRRDRLLDMRGGQVTLRQLDLMRAMADWVVPVA
jgi:CRP-like cAMP-binding protein